MPRALLLLLLIIVVALLGACNPNDAAPVPTVNKIVYYGDSLVNHSGGRLEQYTGVSVTNYGKDAQMAYHAVLGVYGSIDYDQDALYVLSWGTNEDLQKVSPEEYKSNMNHIISTLKNNKKKVVVEVPLKLQFISVLNELSVKYDVPLASYAPKEDEFIFDGVHLTGAGLDNRVRVLAGVVKKEIEKE